MTVAEAGNLTPLKSKYTNEHDASPLLTIYVPKININVIFQFPKEIVWEGAECIDLAQEKDRLRAVVKAGCIKCGNVWTS